MKKSIFLFFAAILCAMTATAATYYYRGGKNSWGAAQMTLSADGAYYYYQASAGSHEFKLTDNDSWSGAEYTNITPTKYNKTDITLSKPGNVKSPSTAAHYILLYFGNDNATPVVCASTTLPNGLNDVWIKHDWGGAGSWTYKQATNNGDGTFSLSANYGASGCNINAYNGSNAQWYYGVSDMEVEAGLQKGDEAVFTVNAVTRKITITKKVNKNLGDITITMNCNQQPKIFFWEVEGKTCAEWPGEDMVAAGANTYTYTFEDVDVDLGVNYKINLKEVNENEWATGDLHTTADVTHSVADLNIPQVAVMGVNNWGEGDKMTVSDDYLSASVTLTLNEIKKYDLKLKIGEDWKGHKDQNHITRAATSSVFKDNDGNGSVDVDFAGDYVFTYTYKTQTLEVTYPELPTPEYKDITIQVYAKEVPNIWWWNGGDQCPSTEAIVNPSTGNKYQWNEAPAMEKVAGEDNWYTKTFAQVDITKGGIKFKLQSTDHSTSTTNEVVTTEDKCYDARVIATVTETTCGELPSGEIPTVTYNVTVPAETPACYIAGEMTGWAFTPMTKVDDTHYTITIEGAEKTNKYKYTCDEGWDYVEKNADGSDISDRTWTESDVVEKWGAPAPTYDYYICGSFNSNNPKNAENGMTLDGGVYKATVTLAEGDNTLKVTDGSWDNTWGYSNLGAAYDEVSDANDYNNIKITLAAEAEKNITVIFDLANNLITFTGLTKVTHTYTIAGDAALCGEAWNWELVSNDMTNNGDGTYTWTKAGVEVNGELSFKVFVDHKSEPAYPAENWVIKPENYEGNGVYDVTITFTESSKEVAVALTKQEVTPTPDYTRAVTPGNYGTICLPYASDNFTGATFFEVAGKEGDKVFFDEVTTLEAGVPYVFLAEANKIVLSQTGESADEAGYSNSLQGTFVKIDPAEDNILKDNYMVVNNVIKKCGANCGLEANRAYFIATVLENLGTPSALVPGRRRVAIGQAPQVATGMENVDASAQPVKMIIDGQLFILRGEKMYDAQGKLVK